MRLNGSVLQNNKSFIGGACITLGTFTYLTTLQKTNSFIASMTFYLGLFLILELNANLFTGAIYTKSDLPPLEYDNVIINILLYNLLGSIVTTLLLSTIIKVDISSIIQTKIMLTPIQLLISSFFCNIFVCTSVYVYQRCHNHILSWFIITCFVLLGFEHSIANITYSVLGILHKSINLFECFYLLTLTIFGNVLGGVFVTKILKER